MPGDATAGEAVPILRPGARVILLDRDDRVLLFGTRELSSTAGPHDGLLWITTGGALEDGESYEGAALRELWEETGIDGVELSPCVWVRQHVWRWGDTLYDSRERYYLARVDRAEVRPQRLDGMELQSFVEARWWSVQEIDVSTELFVPLNLAALLPPLIAGELPPQPLEVGE